MYKLNKNKAPLTFNKGINQPFHKYLTKSSENCFSYKAIFLKSTIYSISFRGPKIWNRVFTKEGKELQWLLIFKKVGHSNLLKVSMNLNIFELSYVT